jgi:hypothetical protein
MKKSYRFLLMIGLLGLFSVSMQAQEYRSRDDDDERPEEHNIAGSQVDDTFLQFHHSNNNSGSQDNGGGTVIDEEQTSLPGSSMKVSLEDLNIEIYPNPVRERLNVDLKQEMDVRISLLNILGQEVYAEQGEMSQFSLYVRDYKSGIYFLNIQAGEERMVRKVKLVP